MTLPTNLKVIRGTLRPCRENKDKPTPQPLSDLSPPACLTALEKKCWNETVTKLQECGVMSEIDTQAFIAYCKCWVAWNKEQDILRKQKTFADGDKTSVHFRTSDALLKQLIVFWREFGMTPVSRGKVKKIESND